MKSNRIRISAVFLFAMIAFSVLSMINILVDAQRPDYYSLLWLLPLSFLLVTVVLLVRYDKLYFSSITGTIAVLIYFVRMVVTPLFMSMGGYASIFDESVYSANAAMAIILMSYETFAVFLLLTAFLQKSRRLSDGMQYPEEEALTDKRTRPSRALWLIIAAMSAFILYLIARDSTIWKANFLLLIDIDQSYHAFSSAETGIGTLSMYVEIMNSLFKLIQVILPPMLLYYIARKSKGKHLKYVVTFALFLMVVIVATDDRIDAIFAGLALLFTVRDTFGAGFRNRFSQWLAIICFAGIFGLAIKSRVVTSGAGGADWQNASKMLTSYFSGVPTVAAGIGMSDSLEGLNLLHIFPDSVSKIPYFAYALNLFTGVSITNSNQLLNDYIRSLAGRGYGQILPSTAIGYEYVGMVLAPLLPALFLKLALYFERNIKMQSDIVRRNLYYWITICVASSPVISSVLLITAKLSWFFIAIVLMWALQKRRDYVSEKRGRE